MTKYTILLNQQTHDRITRYLTALKTGKAMAGDYLQDRLPTNTYKTLTTDTLLSTLINTKRPQIFAESAVIGDGSDWSSTELSLLGDISIAAPVTVFDNGRHTQPVIFPKPFDATLLFTPGALLNNMRGQTPADWRAVTTHNQLDLEKYYQLYARRLWPVFAFANEQAEAMQKKAFVTIPGLGCGAFAGPFHGRLGTQLKQVLMRFLQQHGPALPHIKAVYFDPYSACDNERHTIHTTDFLVRPLTQGNAGKSQLCPPTAFAESGDDFSDCELFSIVAWDHVSWPGNDFYINSRATDDGVKAAATNVMQVMTGIAGQYHATIQKYTPPKKYPTWLDVVMQHDLQIEVAQNVRIFAWHNNAGSTQMR